MAIVVDKNGNPVRDNQLKPVKRIPLKNKQKEVRELSAAEKAAAKARERQALKLFSEFANKSAEINSKCESKSSECLRR